MFLQRSIEIEAAPNGFVDVEVSFTGDKTMRRVYMTKNVYSDN